MNIQRANVENTNDINEVQHDKRELTPKQCRELLLNIMQINIDHHQRQKGFIEAMMS